MDLVVQLVIMVSCVGYHDLVIKDIDLFLL